MSEPVVNTVKLPRIPALLSLDAWRGFAAIWVVMGHSCIAYMGTHIEYAGSWIYQFSSWCQIGVVIFFTLSGYCICGAAYNSISSNKTLGKYFYDRVKRIYPPYLIACLACILLIKITLFFQVQWPIIPPSNTPPKDLTLQALLANFALVHIPLKQPHLMLVAWSLCYEVAFYFIIGIFIGIGKWLQKDNTARQMMILFYGCVLLTVGVLVALNISALQVMFPFNLWYQFGLGAMLFIITASKNWPPKHKRFFLVAVGICLFLLTSHAVFSAHSGPGHFGAESPKLQAYATLLFFGVFFVQRKFDLIISQQKFLKPLMWVGTFSYSLYLVHAPLLAYPDAGLRRIGFVGDAYIIVFFAQIILSLIGGWVFYRVIETRFISVRQAKRIETDFADKAQIDQ